MEVNLDDWYRPEVDRKTLKVLIKRRDLPGLIHFFLYFLSLFISGYLAYVTLGTWWTYLFFFIYGTIYAFSVANWHETVHRTAFRTRWINEFFYHISSFMCDFEGLDGVGVILFIIQKHYKQKMIMITKYKSQDL